MKNMDILVRMCEECMKKLKGRPFKGASRYQGLEFRYCESIECLNKGTFVVTLRLPERKMQE